MSPKHRTWTPELRLRLGLALLGAGLLILAYGIVPRFSGHVTYGDRGGPMTTLQRDANPRLFDQITRWHIASGTLLVVGGLGLAWAGARSRKRA